MQLGAYSYKKWQNDFTNVFACKYANFMRALSQERIPYCRNILFLLVSLVHSVSNVTKHLQ